MPKTDVMMIWFEYQHLSPQLQIVSRQFYELASFVCGNIDEGPQRTIALNKLLEAKDAAVRARLNPGR